MNRYKLPPRMNHMFKLKNKNKENWAINIDDDL